MSTSMKFSMKFFSLSTHHVFIVPSIGKHPLERVCDKRVEEHASFALFLVPGVLKWPATA